MTHNGRNRMRIMSQGRSPASRPQPDRPGGDTRGRVRLAVVLAGATALLCAAILAQPARAGTYEVSACNAAGGVNRSWQAITSDPQAMVIRQRCPTTNPTDGLGSRTTTLALHVAPFTNAHWRFDAPAGTTIVGLEWSGELDAESPGWASRIEGDTGVLRECNTSRGACGTVFRYGEPPISQVVPGARWLRAITVCASALGCDTGDGAQYPNAQNYMWSARVRISDPSPPELDASGPLAETGWQRGNRRVDLAARDASGVLFDAVSVDGTTAGAHPFACDYTVPRPCRDSSSSYEIATAGLSDGAHEVVAGAADAAGNESRQRLAIRVDNHAPAAPSGVAVAGGQGWRATNAFDVSWANAPQGGGSPIVAARLRVCRLDMPSDCAAERRVAGLGVARASGLTVPGPGAWTLRVALEDEAGNLDPGALSDPVVLRFDDTVPGPAAPAARGWLTRAAAQAGPLPVRLADGVAPPPSGIAGYSVTTDGSFPDATIDAEGAVAALAVGGLPEGVTRVRARAISGAGVASGFAGEADVRIDATPPTASIDPEPDPARWQREPLRVRVHAADQPGLSGLDAAPAGRPASEGGRVEIRVDDGPPLAGPGSEGEIVLDRDGRHALSFRAIDAAGNASAWRTIAVRMDSTPPEVAWFLPPDPRDPRRLEVLVADRTSGVAGGAIRLRAAGDGAWRALPTALREGRLEALADDADLAPGPYEFEATVSDAAGNVRRTDRMAGGEPAWRFAPFRVTTRLRAGLIAPARAGRSERAVSSLAVAHGRAARLRGALLTTSGRPVAASFVTIWATPSARGAVASRIGTARTDSRGRFGWRVAAGPSRRISLRYGGAARVLGSRAEVRVRVPARTTLTASPRSNRVGGTARFSGRLLGGHLPPGGKLVLVQARVPSRGWQTFAASRASRRGRWEARYRFRATVGTVRYRIRAVVPAEAAYPFGRVVTAPVTIVVRG